MKKNILYFGHFDLKQKNAAYFRVKNNGKILNSLGFNVIYFGVIKKNDPDYKLEQDEMFFSYPANFLQWLIYFFYPKILFEKIRKLKDLNFIILYDPSFFIFLYFLLYSKKNKIKLLIDLTEWYGFDGSNFFTKIIKGIDSNLVLRFLCKKVDGLILVSKNFYKYYLRFKNKVYIPPLVDIEEKKWENNFKLSINSFEDNIIKFIYFGEPGCGSKDDLKFLIKTFSNLKRKNFIFNIVGITEEDFFLIDNNRIHFQENNIKFHGRLDHEKTLELLKCSDFSIFIRKNNKKNNFGFPTKFVESFSMGIPVITNNTSNITDYLIDGYNGFIVDYKTAEKKLNYILNLKKYDIIEIKSNVKRDLFWYKKYNNIMSKFINNDTI